MAAQPGEDLAATIFADVHYFYGPPTAKPPHHRFDKGSYVYLYENASERRARLEIANNAGTPDQDAFDGFLDKIHMEYSYKHSCLITVRVDAVGNGAAIANDQEWRLPTFDPKNENKYLYKLHTIDLYFWEKEDALVFLSAARRVLPSNQLTILDEPVAPAAHPEAMSPIVQQLENIAISDPSYQNGQTRDSRPNQSLPGPPLSAIPKSEEPTASFAPLAYNPAAPAAPETIKHREKTPPPPEEHHGNPLAAAALADQSHGNLPTGYNQFAPPPPSALGPQHGTYFPGPPQAPQGNSPYASPPPQAVQRTQSFPQNTQTQPTGYNPQVQPTAYNPQAHPQPQYATHPGSQGFAAPMQSPGIQAPMQSPGFSPPPQFNQGLSGPPPPASAPPGGFSTYQYTQAAGAPPSNEYNVHQQVYRPTEGEAIGKVKPGAPASKLGDSAVKLEKGVTGFLKKLEKKYG